MLFEQIQSNKRKTILIVISFIFLVLLVGAVASYYLVGDLYSGIVISAIITIFYVPISIISSQKLVLKMNHAEEIIHRKQAPHLWYSAENLSMVAQIPMPKLFIIREDSPNAFASGLKPENASIAVTTGLLKKLNREEIEAVVAHEIAHIRNYDVRLSTISIALLSVIIVISDFSTRFLINRDNKDFRMQLIAYLFLALAPVIATVMHFALSRNREFLADASGAELCRNPLALASALEKISKDPDPVDNISKETASIYFSEPTKVYLTKKKKRINLFSTHPLPEERISRLKKM